MDQKRLHHQPAQKKATKPSNVLLVGTHAASRQHLARILGAAGHMVVETGTAAEALRYASQLMFDVVLADTALLARQGLDFVETMTRSFSEPVMIVVAENGADETALQAVSRGALDFIFKPFDEESLLHRISTAVAFRDAKKAETLSFRARTLNPDNQYLLLPSALMSNLYKQAARFAVQVEKPVLIVGEAGCGKEHVAQLLHDFSPYSEGPFVSIYCPALDQSALYSELFGHENGAAQGATERRQGVFELAGKGTLFLDEVAALPMDAQASLLRVLETRTFSRLGSTTDLKTDVRVVAATSRDLDALVLKGLFLPDLCRRLSEARIPVPPLRGRPEDIEYMAQRFCDQISRTRGLNASLSSEALAALLRYPWPGNTRELKNVIERIVLLKNGGIIEEADLLLTPIGQSPASKKMPAGTYKPVARQSPPSQDHSSAPSPMSLAKAEALHIQRVLVYCAGNRTRAAQILGIARSTLVRKIADLKIELGGLNEK